jgi:DNA-binding NarL/FixJ family response regulator
MWFSGLVSPVRQSERIEKASAMARALIVEDNELFRNHLTGFLKARFPALEVAEVCRGDQALEEVNTFMPDLIFMDIKLPGENGLSVTAKVKRDHPEIFVIVLTINDDRLYREAAYNSGADFFLVKGKTSLQEMETLISSLLH